MRTIEEIKADIEKSKQVIEYEHSRGRSSPRGDMEKLKRLYYELLARIADSIPYDRLEEICNAERENNLIILTEQLKLSMNAGARAIESNKRYSHGTEYIWNVLSDDSKTIHYVEAAKILREAAKME